MAYPLYANDIGGIGQLLYARQNQRDAQSAQAVAVLLNALERQRQQGNWETQMARQEALQRDQMEAVARENALARVYQNRMLDEYYKPQLKAQSLLREQAAKDKTVDRTFGDILAQAETGNLDDTDEMLNTLPEPQKKYALEVRNQARADVDAQYNRQKALADAVNEQEMLKYYIGASQDAMKDMPNRIRRTPTVKEGLAEAATFPFGPVVGAWRGITGMTGQPNPQKEFEAGRIKDWTSELGTLTRRLSPMQSAIGREVTIDADTGKVIPVMPIPRWRQTEKPAKTAKVLDVEAAKQILQQTGGDKNAARRLAIEMGYQIPQQQ